MKSISLSGGSSAGEHPPSPSETACLVGRTLAQQGWRCLWRRQSWSDGAVADAALEAEGVVIARCRAAWWSGKLPTAA